MKRSGHLAAGFYRHTAPRGEWQLLYEEIDLRGDKTYTARDRVLSRLALKLYAVPYDCTPISIALNAYETVEVSQAANRKGIPYENSHETV